MLCSAACMLETSITVGRVCTKDEGTRLRHYRKKVKSNTYRKRSASRRFGKISSFQVSDWHWTNSSPFTPYLFPPLLLSHPALLAYPCPVLPSDFFFFFSLFLSRSLSLSPLSFSPIPLPFSLLFSLSRSLLPLIFHTSATIAFPSIPLHFS